MTRGYIFFLKKNSTGSKISQTPHLELNKKIWNNELNLHSSFVTFNYQTHIKFKLLNIQVDECWILAHAEYLTYGNTVQWFDSMIMAAQCYPALWFIQVGLQVCPSSL